MKKRIAFLLGLAVALTLLLTACTNTATTVNIRWNEDEEFIFNIELADFNASGDTVFNSYKKEGDDKTLYYKDSLISSAESVTLSASDQLRPVDAKGVYKMTNKRATSNREAAASNREVITEQTLYVQYSTEALQNLNSDILTTLKDKVVSPTDEQNPFTDHDGKTTLKSVTKTGVTFIDDQNQKPVSSYNETDGFYVGTKFQGLSYYNISTVYDFDKRVATVTSKNADGTEKEVKENKLGVSKGAYCLDSNQLLLFIRSLGKGSADFADSPSRLVYDPYYNSLTTANFALNREVNAVLNNNGVKEYVKLNGVVSTVNGVPFMYQLNLPDMTDKSLDAGQAVSATEKPPKYTTVRFRVGWFSYEFASYENYTAELDEIAGRNKTSEDK